MLHEDHVESAITSMFTKDKMLLPHAPNANIELALQATPPTIHNHSRILPQVGRDTSAWRSSLSIAVTFLGLLDKPIDLHKCLTGLKLGRDATMPVAFLVENFAGMKGRP